MLVLVRLFQRRSRMIVTIYLQPARMERDTFGTRLLDE